MIDLSVLDRHEKIALGFSGGKDSTAVLHMLRPYLERITVYHVDTGDLLPDMVEHVARMTQDIPHYVRIETHVEGWIEANGLPTDLLPFSSHPVGVAMGEAATVLVPRYACCWHNLMAPFFARVLADGNTLLIRGTKQADMKILPVASGENADGVEIFLPLENWTHAMVRDYLTQNDVSLPLLYDYFENAPECARCSAWWHEGRAEYLRQFYPKLFFDYDARLQQVIAEIAPVLAHLRREAGAYTCHS